MIGTLGLLAQVQFVHGKEMFSFESMLRRKIYKL